MKVNQFNSNNIDRLVKIQSYLIENYDINVGKILPQKKLVDHHLRVVVYANGY